MSGISTQQLHEATEALEAEARYEGYREYQFIEAFDALCRQAGGYRNGRKLALKLIERQVN